MVPATRLKSRRLRRLSLLIAAVATVTSNVSLQAEDDSVPYGAEPVVVSLKNPLPGVLVPDILESVSNNAKSAGTMMLNSATEHIPMLEHAPDSTPVGSEVVVSETQKQTMPLKRSETENNIAMNGRVTVPVLMASDKAAKSTLELKPVAGPLFGRSRGNRLLRQGLFRSSNSNADQKDAPKPGVAKHNPAIPKPPAHVPAPPAVAARPMPQAIQHQFRQPQNQQYNQPGSNQLNQPAPLRDTPLRDTPLRDTPLRDATSQSVPEYVNSTAPKSRLQFRSPNQPTRAPSLESASRPIARAPIALPPVEKSPPDVTIPRLELESTPEPELSTALNAPARTKPILVSPKAPKKLAAPKRVPSVDVETLEKEVATKPQDSLQDHMRRDAERGSQRDIQKNVVNASKRPEASIASRTRQAPAPARARVEDTMPVSPTLDYVGFPTSAIRVRPETQRLKPIIERNLQYFYDNPEIASGRSNWGMMHAIMVYGIDTRLRAGNRHYSTIAWIAGNNICRGQRLLTHDPRGIKVKSGVGLQGHQAQMLAIFSLCDVPSDYPLYAGETKYSMAHVIEAEKLACKSGEELTFTLIGLAHYLDTDATWIAADGQRWNFERLIREELSQSIVGTACGGTHRLMGFAHALRKRRHEGKPITGQWARAEQFVRDFINYTYTLQNRDGSMSTNWYEGRGDNGDLDRKIQTTGHMVELLLTVTPDAQLQDKRLFNAVRFLAVSMYNDLGREWKIGPKGHALRSLMMYHDRVFQSGPAWQTRTMAQSPSSQYYR